MSYQHLCDRCGLTDPQRHYTVLPEDWVQLDYRARDIGCYHTVHLCEECKKALREFMKGK